MPFELLLDARDLNVHYGHFHALQDVSYSIAPGEIVSRLGGNACGKSTTMKAVLRLVPLTSGEILFDGASTRTESTTDVVVRGIASVPEARRVFPETTIKDNLLVGPTPGGMAVRPSNATSPRSTSCSPGWRNGERNWREPCPAVNNRCWRSPAP